MKKVLIAGLLSVAAIGAQAHEFRGYQPHYGYRSGGDVAGAVIGGMILGAVIDRAVSQPQVVYQQAPLVVSPGTVYQVPVYTQQYPAPSVCVQAYDAQGRYLGCMR